MKATTLLKSIIHPFRYSKYKEIKIVKKAMQHVETAEETLKISYLISTITIIIIL